VASTTDNGKRENDGDSGKEPEICDRGVTDHPNAGAAGSKARDCKANITDQSVTSVRDLLRGRLAKDYGAIAAL
jgi:hypothetical protein